MTSIFFATVLLLGAGLTGADTRGLLVPDGEPQAVLEKTLAPQLPEIERVAAGGSLLLAGAADGSVRGFDVRTFREQLRLSTRATAFAVSSDGSTFALAREGAVVVHAASGEERARHSVAGVVRLLALSADGAFVAIGSSEVAVWKWSRPESPKSLGALAPASTQLAVTTGGRVVVASADGALAVLADGQKELRLDETGQGVTALALSADGTTLATAGNDFAIRVWDLAAGRASARLEGHGGRVDALHFVSAPPLLASAAGDGTVRLWDLARRTELRRTPLGEARANHVFVRGGESLVAWSGTGADALELAGSTVAARLVAGDPALRAIVMHAGGFIAAASADGVVRLLHESTGFESLRLRTGSPVQALALSADARTLATLADPARLELWSASSKERTSLTSLSGGRPVAVVLPAGGAPVVAGLDGHTVVLWTGALAQASPLAGHGADVLAVALSADGRLVASGAADGSVKLWETAAPGSGARAVPAGSDPVAAIALDPRGELLAWATSKGTLSAWDSQKNALRWTKELGAAPRSLAFATDGSSLVTITGRSLRTFDPSGAEQPAVEVPGDAPAVLVAPGRRAVAVGLGDGSVVILRGDNAQPIVARHGPGATWLAQSEGRVYRSDDGRLLLQRAGDGLAVGPVLPAAPEPAPKLSLEVGRATPAVDGGAPGHLALTLRNAAGAGRASWIDVAVTSDDPAVHVVTPARIERLDGGASFELSVELAYESQANAAPRRVPLRLKALGAHGEVAEAKGELQVGAPVLEFVDARLAGGDDGRVVRLRVKNAGTVPAEPVELTIEFLSAGKAYPAPAVRFERLAPGETRRFTVDVPEDAGEGVPDVRVTGRAGVWPTWQWSGVLKPATASLGGSTMAALGLGALLLVMLAWFLFTRLRPAVRLVTKDPSLLRALPIASLAKTDKALRLAFLREGTLARAGLAPANWDRLLALSTGSPAEAVRVFAQALGAKVGAPLAGEACFWVDLPPLALRFPARVPVAVFTGAETSVDQVSRLVTRLLVEPEPPALALALDLTVTQRAAAVIEQVPRVSFVVLTLAVLRELLLAADPVPILDREITAQRPRAEVSPYRTSGGLDDEVLFFGRERELKLITDRGISNFIVVAPRQTGKSTLMKAARRRLAARGDVDVQHFTVFREDLLASLGRHLGVPKPKDAEEFMTLAAGTRKKPRVWLIDEADGFVLADSAERYPIAQAMRTLSEEGRAFFILAGFWHLYAAAVLNPNNPLRNFGEVIRLGPLEREAALELVTRPMTALGITWDEPATVAFLVDELGARAHLIVLACSKVLEQIGSGPPVATREHVERALHANPAILDELMFWRREPLGRAVMRAALLSPPPTRPELRVRLESAGLKVPLEQFSLTLDRLELAYGLVRGKDERLVCPIPLLRWLIEHEDPLEKGLTQDVEEWRAARVAEGE